MEELRGHRAECAARHDDWAFGTERAARSDRNRRGDRLQDRQFRLDAAAVEQNGFNRFRYPVAANAFRAVTGHQADDETANDRHRDDEISQMMTDWRHRLGRDSLVEK